MRREVGIIISENEGGICIYVHCLGIEWWERVIWW